MRYLLAFVALVLGVGLFLGLRADRDIRALQDAPQVREECLPYAPLAVALSGRMERVTVPGPANGESIGKGGEPEMYWRLWADRPVCTRHGGPDEPELSVNALQLMLFVEQYGQYRHLLGQRVVANGTLMYLATGPGPPLVLQVMSLRLATAADTLP